jgi:hypothetical protein
VAGAEGPVGMGADALGRLLHHEVVRAITEPSATLPGATPCQMRMAEFWRAVGLVEAAAGYGFAAVDGTARTSTNRSWHRTRSG